MGSSTLKQEVLPPRKAPRAFAREASHADEGVTEAALYDAMTRSMFRAICVSMALIGTAQVIMQLLGTY